LLANERIGHYLNFFSPAQAPERQAFERQRLRLVGNDLQNFTGLFEGCFRVGLQQS
jgi:hypothetical protein